MFKKIEHDSCIVGYTGTYRLRNREATDVTKFTVKVMEFEILLGYAVCKLYLEKISPKFRLAQCKKDRIV